VNALEISGRSTIGASAVEPAALEMARHQQTVANAIVALAMATAFGLILFARGASGIRMVAATLYVIVPAGLLAATRYRKARRLRRIGARAMTDLSLEWALVGNTIRSSNPALGFSVSASVARSLRRDPLALPAATVVRRNSGDRESK
jgi:hypothetical protein